MDGLTNEVAKNLVLGGVGSVTLVDDVVVTAADVARQFFLHGSGDLEEGDCDDNDSPIGMNRAIAIRERVAEMNPMVRVEARAVDSIAALLKDDAFIEPFDVVCMFNPVASVAVRRS